MNSKNTISKQKRKMILERTRTLLSRLTDVQMLKGRLAQMTESEIMNVCLLLNELLLEEPPCLSLISDDGLFIVGDIHGHYSHLLQTIDELGHPPHTNYLFLGNYVNRGDRSIESLVLLFSYKILYPKNVHLLRGNHECNQLGRTFGFYSECIRRFSVRLWNSFMDTFALLPLAAVVDDSIFCTHSGISPSLIYSGCTGSKALREYLSTWIRRPTEIETSLLATHLLWSVPDVETQQWARNPAGLGYLFGPATVDQFCDQFELECIIRSNEFVSTGYEFFTSDRLLTIFSAPAFLGQYKNLGAVVELTQTGRNYPLLGRIKLLKPTVSNRGKLMGRTVLTIDYAKDLPVLKSRWSAYEALFQ